MPGRAKVRGSPNEQSPLLSHRSQSDLENGDASHERSQPGQKLELTKENPDNPRNWSLRKKYTNVGIISMMAVLSPLASSMFTPGITQIAEDLNTAPEAVVAATTAFVVMLGIGPLILAPLSETFGRRVIYLCCWTIFALLQIPTALSPDLPSLITCRTLAGFFSSVGIANGGGTISDMFPPEMRAGVFGWYLLGPVLGPTLGPLFGGLIVETLGWRWIFWILTIVCGVNTLIAFFFLKESYAPTVLARRKKELEKTSSTSYYFEGEDSRPIFRKVWTSIQRPIRILLTQPVVFTMAAYQALLMGTMYSLYTRFQAIFQEAPYSLTPRDVGLLYLFPGSGFLLAVIFLVPRVDTVFNALTRRHGGVQKPEYRLPLANIGSIFVPLALFYFGWTVQYKLHWATCLSSMPFFGVGVQIVFNCSQNYYIDSFEYAASAIAAGALFRSLVGGVLPLVTPLMFDALGYGWGMSVLGFLAILLAPAPMVFYCFGERLRKRFAIDL